MRNFGQKLTRLGVVRKRVRVGVLFDYCHTIPPLSEARERWE